MVPNLYAPDELLGNGGHEQILGFHSHRCNIAHPFEFMQVLLKSSKRGTLVLTLSRPRRRPLPCGAITPCSRAMGMCGWC